MNKTIWTLTCLCLMSCHDNTRQEGTDGLTVHDNTYVVNDSSPIGSKIQTDTVRRHNFLTEFRTVGTVRAITGKLAEIAPPFDGRVVGSSVRLGQKIESGHSVFRLHSQSFHDATKNCLQARQNYELAVQDYNRKTKLYDTGIASQRDVEEAKTEMLNAEAESHQADAAMQLFNVDTQTLTVGQALDVRSPIAGEVVKCDITIGKYVRADEASLVTVADLSSVWVVALVKERYLGGIKPGNHVRIYTESQPDSTITGNIHYIGEIMDEENRSVEVLIECDNKQRNLKPGMFASVHFESDANNAIVIPANALLQNGDETSVFVQKSKNTYERRPVRIESGEDGAIHVITGLQPGEIIITEGGILLN
ncbi:MAG: efflux RND transporter periplasmic adaptor subunit [Bacteroidales bacterium]|nr:efflux RND transporter periplasmic adaptor subunit [Bacteroidales bacterium]